MAAWKRGFLRPRALTVLPPCETRGRSGVGKLRQKRVRMPHVRNDLVHNGPCACRLAPNRNKIRVAAEFRDVLLNPLKGELLRAGEASA